MLSYGTPPTTNGQQPSSSPTSHLHKMTNSRTLDAASSSYADKLQISPMTPTSIPQSIDAPPNTQHQHIWLVTGPAGCGKSTVGEYIAQAMNFPFIEGDSFHPKANVDKMEAGTPLTDVDRWDWLTVLREEAIKSIKSGSSGVVLACSALKRKYRDVIRVAPYFEHGIQLHFIYLRASEAVIQARVAARIGHYMHADMVHSQFAALEEPESDEIDVSIVEVDDGVEVVEKKVLEMVRKLVEAGLRSDST